ncbi:alpha-amylase family protein [Microvirga subterranea]|uniref:Maltose alpha-D-glucosyltransferase/alpha-amylase n=1 Tax=Microvirga subterranea TaxID=186651 RepID=A0A370HIU9_9HYPH|nr:alpha-amylase family protein [Microvirga subterranea]RDI57952.1 maltose alpha-D-glucosyltransferase/alpha-amylase [Microvirga subterranea]
MLNLWYKNAVIYCVDVETFMDSNGDGVGDFGGLADRLDHIEALGATCIWLLPFYPTPNRDNGYDITDFYGVDPRLGTLGDFVAFAHAAEDRGLRVIVDLVANHTSIDHPWFQQARRDPNSPYRDWYVWSEEKPKDIHEGVVFPGVQDTTWTYDEVAGAWYMHRFYKHQADLNIANPQVREEIEKVMGFWLQLGVSGFRLDAVPFLIEYRGIPADEKPKEDPHQYLVELRDFVSWRRAEAMLLAEANITMDQVDEYFGPSGDRLHTIFNFMLNQHLFLALARSDAKPIRSIMEKTPPIPPKAQWASFLRNHDELDLGRLSDAERQEVFAAFGPDPDMQAYERGIRRRLAPMLGGDERRLKLAFSLMFSLPGTPVVWYGDEIGMGDDLSLKERNSVRTPMQWSDEPNAGFSTAPASRLTRPVVSDGRFDYRKVNVVAQHDLDGSLMSTVQRLIRTRRACPEIGWGACRILETGESSVLALRYDWRGETVLLLHNLADKAMSVRVPADGVGRWRPLFCNGDDRDMHDASAPIALDGYGFRWFRAEGERR